MAEKYRGILPPNSTWFSLNREETIILMRHQGMLEKMTPRQVSSLDSTDIHVFEERVAEFEQILKDAGLTIVTLCN